MAGNGVPVRGGGFVGKPRGLEELAFHDDAVRKGLGRRQLWLSEELWCDADLFITSRDFDTRGARLGWNSEPHVHDVSQTYLLIPSVGRFAATVLLNEKEKAIEGPATIAIGAGTLHALRITEGAGTVISIVRKGTYP